jgi:hypothetical protein
VSAEEAKKHSTHDAFSGDCQFFFAVGVSNAEVHIGEFADFSQAFRLREGSIILSTFFPLRLGSSVSVQRSGSFACGGVWFALFPVLYGRRFSSKRRRASVRYCSTASHRRHNGHPEFCK